ncbi:MAG TPA: hypothetical protein VK524_34560 [Polyangiaceae bacterium]|nr:hypothetical protein [Polyangiaceae bacterium]
MDQLDLLTWQVPPELENATTWRRRLRELEPGQTLWLNGLNVQRVPCAGHWYRVPVCDIGSDIFYQQLGLTDAVSRVYSGYVYKPKSRPLFIECVECAKPKLWRWMGSCSWCMHCVGDVCSDCKNTHAAHHVEAA